MKQVLFLSTVSIVIFSIVRFGYGSPLIFKTTKEIKTNEVIELGSFDASKYKQIRIGLKAVGRVLTLSKDVALAELNSAKRAVENSQSGIYSQADRNEAQARLVEAQKNYDNAADVQSAGVFGVEEENEILIIGFEDLLKHSVVIDSPPTKISIKGFGKGTYKIFIWAN